MIASESLSAIRKDVLAKCYGEMRLLFCLGFAAFSQAYHNEKIYDVCYLCEVEKSSFYRSLRKIISLTTHAQVFAFPSFYLDSSSSVRARAFVSVSIYCLSDLFYLYGFSCPSYI